MDRGAPDGYVAAVHLLTATLKIYRYAGSEAARAFTRSAWALLLLLMCYPLLRFVGVAVSPLGIAGGFIYSLVEAACAGTYLATLQDALSARRSMDLAAIRANLGRYTWEVIGVLFPLWILSMVLGLGGVPGIVGLAVNLAVFLFLNPAPELIGRTRAGGLELLAEAWRFMMHSGPEWIAPHLLILGVGWLIVPADAISLMQLFGPHFGFVDAGALAFAALGGGPPAWAVGAVVVAAIHGIMLLRGALYVRLGSGGRRARAWRERAG